MIEITFKEFYEDRYLKDEFHELYVMKNGLNQILYVGISNQNIWNRWFGWNGHIIGDARQMIGASKVRQKIVDHLPNSWNWKIQLWTLNDCLDFCAKEINPHGKYSIKLLEPFVIQKLQPIMNVSLNQSPTADLMVKSEKEKRRETQLDKAYNKTFGKNRQKD